MSVFLADDLDIWQPTAPDVYHTDRSSTIATDVDSDGRVDIIGWNAYGNTVVISRNR